MIKQFTQFVVESLFDLVPLDPSIKKLEFPPQDSQLWLSKEQFNEYLIDKKPMEELLFQGLLYKQNVEKDHFVELLVLMYGDRLEAYTNDKNEFYGIINLACYPRLMYSDNLNQDEEEDLLFMFMWWRGKCEVLLCENSEIFIQWIGQLGKYCILSNFQHEFSLVKLLGKGTFAKVILCERNCDQKQFAVKTFDKKCIKNHKEPIRIIKGIINEIQILRDLQHPNIIKMFSVYEGTGHLYIVMELLSGGELFHKISQSDNFTEFEVCEFMKSLLCSLEYLHSKGIMHRDIKPQNILLRRKESELNEIVLADFGLSEEVGKKEYLFKKCGTPGYVAPEIFLNEGQGCKVDVFSAGILMYIMMTCEPLFQGKNFVEILTANKECNINFECEQLEHISEQGFFNCFLRIKFKGIDLLKLLLKKNPEERISATEALKHS